MLVSQISHIHTSYTCTDQTHIRLAEGDAVIDADELGDTVFVGVTEGGAPIDGETDTVGDSVDVFDADGDSEGEGDLLVPSM
jgi:hypothetical protein